MDKKQAKERVQELRDLLERANRAYYEEAQPFISDKEFDEALKELEQLEEEYDLQSEDSPTRRVGGKPTSEFPTVRHPQPLLSLANTYNEEELRDFDRRVRDILGDKDFTYAVEMKLMGQQSGSVTKMVSLYWELPVGMVKGVMTSLKTYAPFLIYLWSWKMHRMCWKSAERRTWKRKLCAIERIPR